MHNYIASVSEAVQDLGGFIKARDNLDNRPPAGKRVNVRLWSNVNA